jgi:hypothetical protein
MANGIAPAAVSEIVKAYYPDTIKAADAARTRAQNGYTIAAAVAAAIVAAGVFGDLTKETELVQALGFISLVLWLGAALLFLFAVAGRTPAQAEASAANANAFVEAVFNRARAERERIELRLSWALRVTMVAVVFTIVTLVLAFLTAASSETKHGTVALTKVGVQTVRDLCHATPATINGSLDPATLSDAVTKVKVDAGSCGTARRAVTLQLNKGTIAGFAQD